jgi:hypothetical protein
MAAVTDPNAIRYCNTRIRPLGDKLVQAYWLAKEIIAEGAALGLTSGATPLIPNDTSQIVDGSATDGRPQIQGADVYNIQAIATTLITSLEANTNTKLNQALRVAVNTNP